MIMKLSINDRSALAIKNNTKRIEVRANKENVEHDYSKLKQNDIIEFTSNILGIFYVKVKEVNYYNSLEELFTMEGTKYTTSSTNDKEEAIKNINKLDGYEDAIKQNGVMQFILNIYIVKIPFGMNYMKRLKMLEIQEMYLG